MRKLSASKRQVASVSHDTRPWRAAVAERVARHAPRLREDSQGRCSLACSGHTPVHPVSAPLRPCRLYKVYVSGEKPEKPSMSKETEKDVKRINLQAS